MAEMPLQKKGKKSEDGIGSMVDFLLANARLVLGVGGAAMLGIATLAVKRLIDRAASPPDEKDADGKLEQKSIEESWKEAVLLKASPKLVRKATRSDLSAALPVPEPSRPEQDAAASSANPEQPPVAEKTPMCFTLQETLLHYYTHDALVPEAQTQAVKRLVLDIMGELQNFLKSKHPEMPFSAMQLGGSLGNCLPVTHLDRAHILLPLILEPDLWTFVPGEETIHGDPRFWLIKRVNLEYTARGSSPWDRFMLGGYLSTRTIVESLHKTIVGSINWPAIGTVLECSIRPFVTPDDVRLEVIHCDFTTTINVLPVAETEEAVLLAHSSSAALAENLWRRSYYREEIRHLQELDGSVAGIRQKCLHVLRSICHRRSELRPLSPTHLRHALLHLSKDSSDWSESSMADRFLQVIEALIGHLGSGSLPCYFNEKVNLFWGLTEEEIDEIGYGLYQIFSDPSSLLTK
ncbi:LOW QUALITY PROTEIN: mitochondrial dynamics protein MID49 [Hyla sarda]|uniref:LOW QUALITY PROTEIN: mitochondrial dynamics protein MID49 n=1 Tax=Hyla sarda TaxID=327740 RepID=UPI0024C3DC03|nr:LOW QUALITY PROTEIN: mitochondrial dynamics protein MID49 [Hyla sarda]